MIRWVGAALAAAMAVVGFSTSAQAAPVVTCGSYLEEDAYLTKDLSCPDGNGISLALDVKLDLRGHRLVGPGPRAAKGIGVTLSPAWPSQVTNGTIVGWPVGIGGNEDFETVEVAQLQNLTFVGNGTAVLGNQAYLTLRNSQFIGNGTGVNLLSWGEVAPRGSVDRSVFRGNGTAVQVDARSVFSLTNSVFQLNGTGYTVAAPLPGLPGGYVAELTGNTFTANRNGVYVTVPGTSLGRTTATRNTGWGIYAPGATDLGGNVAHRNGNSPQCVGVAC